MKNNIGDLVAQSMLGVLNSKEHAQLFKKAYQSSCSTCQEDMDNCMCGDMNMSKDHHSNHFKDPEFESESYPEWQVDEGIDDEEDYLEEDYLEDMPKRHSSDHDHSWSWDKSASDRRKEAFYSAMEDLITASAALDYAGMGKASELSIKLAALVDKTTKEKGSAPKGKKKAPVKGKKMKKNPFAMSSKKSVPNSKGKPASSSKKSEKKNIPEWLNKKPSNKMSYLIQNGLVREATSGGSSVTPASATPTPASTPAKPGFFAGIGNDWKSGGRAGKFWAVGKGIGALIALWTTAKLGEVGAYAIAKLPLLHVKLANVTKYLIKSPLHYQKIIKL